MSLLNQNQKKGKQIALNSNIATQRMQEPTREQYKQHPKFAEKMREALTAAQPEFPPELLPKKFDDWLFSALVQRSYPACGSKQAINGRLIDIPLPLGIYRLFIYTPYTEWGFGEIKKAADMIFESRPESIYFNSEPNKVDEIATLRFHLEKLEAVGEIKIWFDSYMQPIEDSVLDEVIKEVKEEQAKAQAKKMIVS